MCVYRFGIVFSPSSTNFANKLTAMDYEKEYSLTTVNTVCNYFYVDVCLALTSTLKEAAAMLHDISLYCAKYINIGLRNRQEQS